MAQTDSISLLLILLCFTAGFSCSLVTVIITTMYLLKRLAMKAAILCGLQL